MKVVVTDHALVRWLQRSHGIDMEGYRRILEGEVQEAAKTGAAYVPIDGLWYVFDNGRLVTVRPSKPVKHHRHDRGDRNGGDGRFRETPHWKQAKRKRSHK